MDGSIGYYIMLALLGAGAAYGMANKGKPKPALSSGKKILAIVSFGVAGACGLLGFDAGRAGTSPLRQAASLAGSAAHSFRRDPARRR